jgi:hypothetical protein
VTGRQVNVSLIAAAADPFRDPDNIPRVDEGNRVTVKLLVERFGLALPQIGEPSLHHRDVFETAGDDEPHPAPLSGEDGVQHAGATVNIGAALSVDVFGGHADRLRRVGHRVAVAPGFVFFARDRLPDGEAAVGQHQNGVGHRPARVEREDVVALAQVARLFTHSWVASEILEDV